MAKNENRLINIMRTALTVFLMLLVLSKINNPLKKEEPKEEGTKVEEKKQFRNSELILWDAFIKSAKLNGWIHEDNLESIELESITDYGRYLKKSPYVRYEQLNYTFKCKDNTEDCVEPQLKIISDNKPIYSRLVIINLKDKENVNIVTGYVFNQNDEFVTVTEPFVYEGEES